MQVRQVSLAGKTAATCGGPQSPVEKEIEGEQSAWDGYDHEVARKAERRRVYYRPAPDCPGDVGEGMMQAHVRLST